MLFYQVVPLTYFCGHLLDISKIILSSKLRIVFRQYHGSSLIETIQVIISAFKLQVLTSIQGYQIFLFCILEMYSVNLRSGDVVSIFHSCNVYDSSKMRLNVYYFTGASCCKEI